MGLKSICFTGLVAMVSLALCSGAWEGPFGCDAAMDTDVGLLARRGPNMSSASSFPASGRARWAAEELTGWG